MAVFLPEAMEWLSLWLPHRRLNRLQLLRMSFSSTGNMTALQGCHMDFLLMLPVFPPSAQFLLWMIMELP